MWRPLNAGATPALHEAYSQTARRTPLAWALLTSVGLHLALLTDAWLPEQWLESADQAAAQSQGQAQDAAHGPLRLAARLLDLQEGAGLEAATLRARQSAALQVDWYRPPPPPAPPAPIAVTSPAAQGPVLVTTPGTPPDEAVANDRTAAGAAQAGGEGLPLPARFDAAEVPAAPEVVTQEMPEPEATTAGLAAAATGVGVGEGEDAATLAPLAQASPVTDVPRALPDSRDAHLGPPVAPEWQMPPEGRLHFTVSRGEGGFVVGRAQHRWQHDGERYTLENITQTTGLAALIHPSRVVWRSRGRITSQGLQPVHFVVEKNGREVDVADLNWPQMQLKLSGRNQRELPLLPMTQDLLSMFYQLAYQLPEILSGREIMQVTNGRKLERYQFHLRGQEVLQLKPVGKVATVHVQVRAGEQLIDIWLAPTLAGLPVRIRYADGKGESFDQLLDEFEVATISAATP